MWQYNSFYDTLIQHHGILGQKWGIRRYQNADGTLTPEGRARYFSGKNSPNISNAKNIANQIKNETERYENGGPAGNQNCQLCTWSMECSLRGKDVLPRPVYSPRDVIFTLSGYDIVKKPEKKAITGKQDVQNIVQDAGDGARFYTHVNWKDSSGGHEFIVANFNGEVYVLDGQAGIASKINSEESQSYFSDVNFSNSFLVRMDNKELNIDILKYNDKKYITEWDDEEDIRYLQKHNMLGKEEKLSHSFGGDMMMGTVYHHGILGQKWGIRRYQNADGTLTPEGRARLEKYKTEQMAKVKNDRYSEHKRAAIESMTFEQMTYEKRQKLFKDIAKGLEIGSAVAAPILGATVVAPWMSAKALELFSDPEVRSKITGLLSDFMKSEAAQTAIGDISSDAIKLGTEVMNSPEMRKAAEQIITENIITERKLVERRG